MAELPESWGLTTKKNDRGTLDIIGKDDAGNDYKVRSTDQPFVTDTDISELHDADRESYADRKSGARELMSKITDYAKRKQSDRDSKFQDELASAAEDMIGQCTENGMATRPGMIEIPLSMGMSSAYRRGERYFAWKKRVLGDS